MKKADSFVILLASSLSACVAPALDDETFDESFAVSEVEQELGEVGCGTVAPDATLQYPNESVTSGSTYGTPECPGQYVVRFSQFGGTHGVGPVQYPATETECGTFFYQEGHYKSKKILYPQAHWVDTLLASVTYHGVWVLGVPDTIPGYDHCELVLNSESDLPPNPPPTPGLLTKYRVAASAFNLVPIFVQGNPPHVELTRVYKPIRAYNSTIY